MVSGYWKDPAATAAAFTPDGWLRTGDIGHLDKDGYLYIDDRKKDMIVSGGENVATSEVERVLYEHDAVLEAAVVGMPDPRWGEVPRAFIVLKPGHDLRAEVLIAHCRARLAGSSRPRAPRSARISLLLFASSERPYACAQARKDHVVAGAVFSVAQASRLRQALIHVSRASWYRSDCTMRLPRSAALRTPVTASVTRLGPNRLPHGSPGR